MRMPHFPNRHAWLLALFALGVSAIGAFSAGLIIATPDQGQASLTSPAQASAKEMCSAHAERIGASWQSQDGRALKLTDPRPDTTESAIERAETLLRGCPGYELVGLCAGAQCDQTVEVELQWRP